MIKEIKIEGWSAIQEKINALPEERKRKYEELEAEYEKAVEEVDHEMISELIKEAKSVLGE